MNAAFCFGRYAGALGPITADLRWDPDGYAGRDMICAFLWRRGHQAPKQLETLLRRDAARLDAADSLAPAFTTPPLASRAAAPPRRPVLGSKPHKATYVGEHSRVKPPPRRRAALSGSTRGRRSRAEGLAARARAAAGARTGGVSVWGTPSWTAGIPAARCLCRVCTVICSGGLTSPGETEDMLLTSSEGAL